MRHGHSYDTDDLRLGKEIREKLAEAERAPNGCLLFASGQIAVDRRGGGLERQPKVEVQRVAFALAHPETHVGKHDTVLHTCSGCGEILYATGGARRNVCIEPSHLTLKRGEE